MNVYITRKRAREAASKLLSRAVTSFVVQPFIELHRDGSSSHGYRAALYNRFGTFQGWA